jgi:ketosteroid isomerase-like protein
MSRETVELVRHHLEPYDAEDFVHVLSEAVDRLGPDPEPDDVLALWAEDPSFHHLYPEVVWEVAIGGPLDVKATGPTEILRWWAEWLELWESYVYRAAEYRDLGEWVLTSVDVRARGRDGIPVEMRTFEVRRVRDGKIVECRIFETERRALEAAGLRE